MRPPSQTAYEGDAAALAAQFDVAEALLKEIQESTAASRAAAEEQKAQVDAAVQSVEKAVEEIREGERRAQTELKELRDEVESVKDMLPKMMDKNKDNQNAAMAELQQELKSLKALLLTRKPDAATPVRGSSPSSSSIREYMSAGRPTIPAWQLASASSSPGGGGVGVGGSGSGGVVVNGGSLSDAAKSSPNVVTGHSSIQTVGAGGVTAEEGSSDN